MCTSGVGNVGIDSPSTRGENTPLEVRTVASIRASIPSERWDCDTTLVVLGVEVLLFVFISVILAGEVSVGGVLASMMMVPCYLLVSVR